MKKLSVAKNIKKRLARFTFYALLVIVSLPIVITVLFRSPIIQTLSARLVTEWVSEKMDREISIESLNISFFDGINVGGLKAFDHKSNPLLILNSLTAMPEYSWSAKLGFNNIEIDGASFTYGRYKDDDRAALMMFLNLDTAQRVENDNTFRLYSKRIRITNSNFRLFDETKSYSNDKGMDYADIVVSGINGYLQDVYIINDSINLKIQMLMATERCGMKVENLSADFSISSKRLQAYNASLSTAESQLNFDLDFLYSSYSAMSEFIDSVEIRGEIRPSQLNLADLGYFSDVMFEMPDAIKVSGSVIGKVKELKGDGIFLEYGENTSFTGDIYIKGLPDFFNSYISMGVHDFRTSKCDIQSFILPIDEKNIDVPLELKCDDNISAIGSFVGYYGKFKSNLDIELPDGKLKAEIEFDADKNDSLYLQAKLIGEDLNIGKILLIDEITGPLSFKADMGMIGLNQDDLTYSFDVNISSAGLINHNINRIKLLGYYYGDTLNTSFRVGDKNLMASGNLLFANGDKPMLDMKTEIVRVNLNNLGLWDKNDSHLSSNVSFKFMGSGINYSTAELLMHNSVLTIKDDIYQIDSIYLRKEYDGQNGHNLIFRSDIANAILKGDFLYTELASNSQGILNYYYPFSDAIINDTISKYAELSVEIKDSRLIQDQFVIGLEIENGTKADMYLDFKQKQIGMSLESERLNYYGIDFIENIIDVKTKNSSVIINYEVKNIILKDSSSQDKNVLGLENFQFLSTIGDSSAGFDVSWHNADTLMLSKGRFGGRLKHQPLVEVLKISYLGVVVNNVQWKLNPANRIYFDSLGVGFSNMNISTINSSLFVNGRIPKNESDSLSVVFENWDISYFDILSKPYNMDIDGIINGDINIGLIGDNPTLISNINIDGFVFNGQYLGKSHFLNTWDNVNKSIYFNGQIIDDRQDKLLEVFLAEGYYYPFLETDALDINFKFNAFELPAIEPFLDEFVSEIKGSTTGELSLKGTIEKPIVTGFANINETSLLINYLNTRYSFSDKIVFDEDMLHFDQLTLYDTLGNRARITGNLKHDNFNDPWFDVTISSDKLLFFNTTRKMNELYYGTGILSGDISINGAPDDIKLSIETSTKQGTKVFLPLDYTTVLVDKDYIIFLEPELDSIAKIEEYEENIANAKRKAEKDELKYDIDLQMKITPVARINIAMPSDMGRIEAQGNGDIKIDVNSDGDFGLYGEYIIDRGIFHFTFENLVNKRFELVKGGRISWTGDPYLANINIKGLYKVKANLASLGVVIDSSATYKNKVNVECYIILKNQLMDPTIIFEIVIPDIDPDLQRIVYAQLDTTNQAMVNQQMISLLVLGTFSNSNASSINLSTSYYTILTNQLSGMLSQISDDFDIGVNYKPGDNITNEEFEVALSTQLLDDRLIIDGNFGVSYDRTQQNASNIVGDVDIAYKLTADGRWMLKAFNHSNVNSWYYYNSYDKVSPYTQGVGIAYRKEFNNLKDFFKRIRKHDKDAVNSDAKIE